MPEILAKGCRLTSASVEDLMKADIWAYGFNGCFSLTNPGLKHAVEVNMLTCIGTYTPLQCLEVFCREEEADRTGEIRIEAKE